MTAQDHFSQLLDLLQEVRGTRDVMSIEYNTITPLTEKASIDFSRVRGSVRLANPDNVLMPKDTEEMIKAYLATPLP